MSEMFWIIMFIPLMLPFIGKIIFKCRIQWTEMVLQFCVALVVGMTIYHIGKYSQIYDVEIWNGEVLSKRDQREECVQRWRRTAHWFCTNNQTRQVEISRTCDSEGRCTSIYATEYRNIFPWEHRYFVTTSFGEVEVPRIDRQGANFPPLYTKTEIGEPASRTNRFENYVKAASSSLFNFEQSLAELYAEHIPTYPNQLYELWKVDRVFQIGVQLPDIAEWNYDLGMILREAGPKRQANAVIIINNIESLIYPDAVIQKWQGGKKNDTLLFISVDENMQIQHVRVHSWSKNEYYNVALRDEIAELGVLDRESVIRVLHSNLMNHFERRSMKEFEYLKDEIEPSTGQLIFLFIFVTLFSGLMTYGFSRINLNEIILSLFSRR